MNIKLTLLIASTALSVCAQDPTADAFVQRYGTPDQKAKIKRRAATAAAATASLPSEFRVVTNHVFNVPRSIYWKPFKGECQKFLTNGIVMQEVIITQVYETTVPYAQSIGAYGGPPTRRVISETRTPGKQFLLRNCPAFLHPTTGKEITGKAMQTGTIQIGQDILEVWDCGIPYAPKS